MSLLHDVVEVVIRREVDGAVREERFRGDQIKTWLVKTTITGPKSQSVVYYQVTIPIPEEML